MKKALILVILLATTIGLPQQAQAKTPYVAIFACTALASSAGAIYCHINEQKLYKAIGSGNIDQVELTKLIKRYKLLKYALGGTAVASASASFYCWLKNHDRTSEIDAMLKFERANCAIQKKEFEQIRKAYGKQKNAVLEWCKKMTPLEESPQEAQMLSQLGDLKKEQQMELKICEKREKQFISYVKKLDPDIHKTREEEINDRLLAYQWEKQTRQALLTAHQKVLAAEYKHYCKLNKNN